MAIFQPICEADAGIHIANQFSSSGWEIRSAAQRRHAMKNLRMRPSYAAASRAAGSLPEDPRSSAPLRMFTVAFEWVYIAVMAISAPLTGAIALPCCA